MIVIIVAVYDTDENDRLKYTKKAYESLVDTVDFNTSKVVFVNNASCQKATQFLNKVPSENFFVIHNENNIGTAEAINIGIKKHSKPGDFIVKLDNDVVFGDQLWADNMMECIISDPSLGVLGLKRKDLPNAPDSKEYPTKLEFAKREFGEAWHPIEICGDIIGTCHMYNPALIEKVGYLYQPGLYGFDDVLMCVRSKLAGFRNAFYPSVKIDHIDTGETEYVEWKRKYAGTQFATVNKIIAEYNNGERQIYYNGNTSI